MHEQGATECTSRVQMSAEQGEYECTSRVNHIHPNHNIITINKPQPNQVYVVINAIGNLGTGLRIWICMNRCHNAKKITVKAKERKK